MASSRSHRDGIRRLSVAAWAGILLVLALALLATFSSANPIQEKKEAAVIEPRPPGSSTIEKSPVAVVSKDTDNNNDQHDEITAAGSPEFFTGGSLDTTIAAGTDELQMDAQSSASDYFNTYYNYINVPLTWQRCVAGGILMAIGLYMTLFGFCFQRFTLLITGFVGGIIAAYAILVNVEPEGQWSNRVLIYCAVCIAAGLLIGLILLAFNRWAIWILGGAGGLALGVYIMSWKDGTLIHNGAGRIGLMVGCAALGALLGLILGPYVVLFATVLLGAYMFTVGLDMFLRTGFNNNYQNMFRASDNVDYVVNGGIYGMLGVVSLLFLLGFLIQGPLYIRHLRAKRRKARAAAVPPVNGPYSPYYPYGPGAGSRDKLLVGPNSGAAGEKREYNWWGKRINKYPQQPMPPPHAQARNQPYYNEKAGGGGAKVAAAGVGAGAGTRAQTAQAGHVAGQTQSGNTVVFEEKKDWRGRPKVVPKVVAAGAAGAAVGAAANHRASGAYNERGVGPTGASTQGYYQGNQPNNYQGNYHGEALPTVVYKEKKNWKGESKLVSVVDNNKPMTIEKMSKTQKTGGKGKARESTDLLEDTVHHPEVPLSSAYDKKSTTWNPFSKNKRTSSKVAPTNANEPNVRFSGVEGPSDQVGVQGTRDMRDNDNVMQQQQQMPMQQPQQQFYNQSTGMQPQMQPNNYAPTAGGYNYYQPPAQDQMAYILVGLDGQNPAPMENVMQQTPAEPYRSMTTTPTMNYDSSGAQAGPSNYTTSAYGGPSNYGASTNYGPPVAQGGATTYAPAVAQGGSTAGYTGGGGTFNYGPSTSQVAASNYPQPMGSTAQQGTNAMTTTPATTTTTTMGNTPEATATSAATPATTQVTPAKSDKKLKGLTMSKLFGRKSTEQADPIVDTNTDGLNATTTANTAATQTTV